MNAPKTVQNVTAPATPSGVNRNVRSAAIGGRSSDRWRGDRIRRAAAQHDDPRRIVGREMVKAAVPAESVGACGDAGQRARGDEPATSCDSSRSGRAYACASRGACAGSCARAGDSAASTAPRGAASEPGARAPRASRGTSAPPRRPFPKRRSSSRRARSSARASPKSRARSWCSPTARSRSFPTSDPSTTLCAIPYGRVISINVSKSRDPLWNSPQGPAPVARAGRHAQQVRHRGHARMDLAAHQHRRAVRRDALRRSDHQARAAGARGAHRPSAGSRRAADRGREGRSRAGPSGLPTRSHFCKARAKTAHALHAAAARRSPPAQPDLRA